MQRFEIERVINLALEATELDICATKRGLLAEYTELLMAGLKKLRITGERTVNGIVGRLIVDSVYALKFVDIQEGSRVVDLGSGGGIPGIPLKICLPDIYLYLMDSNRKKIAFMRSAVRTLQLKNVEFMPDRAEYWGQDPAYRGRFDCLLSKAVAEIAVLAEYALPLLRTNGKAFLYKGPAGYGEVEAAKKSVNLCGGVVEQVIGYMLPSGEERLLVTLRKVGETPPEYPRPVGKPSKSPIQ